MGCVLCDRVNHETILQGLYVLAPFFSRTYLGLPDLGQADIVVEKYPQGHRCQSGYSSAIAISEITSGGFQLFGFGSISPLPTHQRLHIDIISE